MNNKIEVRLDNEGWDEPVIGGKTPTLMYEVEQLVKTIMREAGVSEFYISDKPSKEDYSILVRVGTSISSSYSLYYSELANEALEMCDNGILRFFEGVPEYIYVSLIP